MWKNNAYRSNFQKIKPRYLALENEIKKTF